MDKDKLINSSLVEKCFYKIKLFLQPADGTEEDSIDISESINGMIILKEFNAYAMPIIRVVANLSLIQVKNIQENFNRGDAFLTIEKYIQDRNGANRIPEDALDKIYDNAPLTIVGLDRTEINSAYLEDPELYSNEANMPNISFPIELVPTNALKMNEEVSPQVLADTNTINVLTKVISDNHVSGYKVCLAKPDLQREYKSINVPAKSVNQLAKYVQQVYGIYNSPLISFFDINRYYLMASGKLAKFPTDKPKDETNCEEAHIVFITDEEEQLMYSEGSYFDEESQVAKCVSFMQPRVDLADPASKYIDGDHVKLMTGNYAERDIHECFMQSMGNEEDVTAGKEKIKVARYDNPTTAKQYQFESQERYAPTELDINSVDMRIFDPRKKFLFMSKSEEQTALEGFWRLSGVQFTFMGTGNSEDTIMTLNIKGSFKPYLGSIE